MPAAGFAPILASVPSRSADPLSLAAAFFGPLRWLLLPLSMCALLAVGIHAAADVLSDQFLTLVDRVDAAFDSLFSLWSVTAPLVDLVGFSERTFLARSAALLLELIAGVYVAFPALGYDEREGEVKRALEAARKVWKRPALLPISRVPFTAAFALAGACSVARLAHGSLYASLRFLGAGAAQHLASSGALLVLLGVLAAIAWRAALHELVRTQEQAQAEAVTPRQRVTHGLFAAALLAPLALAAILRAAPLASFFR